MGLPASERGVSRAGLTHLQKVLGSCLVTEGSGWCKVGPQARQDRAMQTLTWNQKSTLAQQEGRPKAFQEGLGQGQREGSGDRLGADWNCPQEGRWAGVCSGGWGGQAAGRSTKDSQMEDTHATFPASATKPGPTPANLCMKTPSPARPQGLPTTPMVGCPDLFAAMSPSQQSKASLRSGFGHLGP